MLISSRIVADVASLSALCLRSSTHAMRSIRAYAKALGRGTGRIVVLAIHKVAGTGQKKKKNKIITEMKIKPQTENIVCSYINYLKYAPSSCCIYIYIYIHTHTRLCSSFRPFVVVFVAVWFVWLWAALKCSSSRRAAYNFLYVLCLQKEEEYALFGFGNCNMHILWDLNIQYSRMYSLQPKRSMLRPSTTLVL